eukprot:CAMPEP_0206301974 /NCGR_PEP_ID=MMETSP0106_2-20121207/8486_1 /ASSEMBLY_ACC=CAM_ASM_000206 /TAXON_ID=81532 /ORGANISM="Acanthoeca-like sp., Strain 10tr" /LENGTH=84 /DNA_ID=CAMNT_0053732731 /DNA_START=46 /DNA_END=297 /DNA_ORIENTATION=-
MKTVYEGAAPGSVAAAEGPNWSGVAYTCPSSLNGLATYLSSLNRTAAVAAALGVAVLCAPRGVLLAGAVYIGLLIMPVVSRGLR